MVWDISFADTLGKCKDEVLVVPPLAIILNVVTRKTKQSKSHLISYQCSIIIIIIIIIIVIIIIIIIVIIIIHVIIIIIIII